MKDSVNAITKESFKANLIASEIIITAIVLIGFYLIFNKFNKKQRAFKEGNNK